MKITKSKPATGAQPAKQKASITFRPNEGSALQLEKWDETGATTTDFINFCILKYGPTAQTELPKLLKEMGKWPLL